MLRKTQKAQQERAWTVQRNVFSLNGCIYLTKRTVVTTGVLVGTF